MNNSLMPRTEFGPLINRFKSALSLVLIVALIVVVVGCTEEMPELVATAEPATLPAAPPQAVASPAPTPASKAETFNIGDTVELGDLQVTVHGVWAGLGDDFWTPEEGHYFVYVDVGFRNAGDESDAVS